MDEQMNEGAAAAYENVDIDISLSDGESGVDKDIEDTDSGEEGFEEYEDREDDVDVGEVDWPEFDDEGNIVVPSEEVEAKAPENDKGNGMPENDPKSEKAAAPDERDAEIARLKRELAERDGLVKDALSHLGVESGEDIRKDLIRLAAEGKGVSDDEYLRARKEQISADAAKEYYRIAKFNEKKARDLSEIHKAYPETVKYTDVEQLPNFKRFYELRDAGSTAAEAYIASHSQLVMDHVAESAKQSARNGNKNHLKSSVPKGVNSGKGITMSRAELAQWREMFPEKSDREIVKLYGKTK